MRTGQRTVAAVALITATVGVFAQRADAAENAAGFYLLGAKTAMAGFVPPPGKYVTDINYYYTGDAGGQAAVGIALRQTGAVLNIQADVELDATAYINAPVALWVAPGKVLGGNVGFGVMLPVGYKNVDIDLDARATLTLANGTTLTAGRHFDYEESQTNLGDPLLNALIGWHEGNWHYTIGALVNVPIGPYDRSDITNIAFHHWGVDTTAGLTYLDPKSGLEVSTAVGLTFNWENPSTDYRTGTELHVEAALIQHLSKTFSIGLSGYYYNQLTGDSGAGATLGDFEGRVWAIGPVATYTFVCGKTPISTQLEWMHEFDAVNRTEGDMGMLNVTVPLGALN